MKMLQRRFARVAGVSSSADELAPLLGATPRWVVVAFGAVVVTGAFVVVFAGAFVVGATALAFGFAEVETFGLGATVVIGAAGAVMSAAGRGTVGVSRSWNDEIHAVTPAMTTTTTMLMPTSGASDFA
ncbi:hypothetical protein SAMN05443637_113113 [Pseudonocardia thermophila]|jgi:hypothetical protein|uniref:Uncharacterized protein n=1 Tax=Pseudonocardia thermophila TaxID=1848 RepID=A0A1M6VXH4_PSETH|nr:hypothetical protein SAMN05443637_113113 [Pseudonocardia thermophila]